jgi:hypothetical protein
VAERPRATRRHVGFITYWAFRREKKSTAAKKRFTNDLRFCPNDSRIVFAGFVTQRNRLTVY